LGSNDEGATWTSISVLEKDGIGIAYNDPIETTALINTNTISYTYPIVCTTTTSENIISNTTMTPDE
jgi:hypothetical protein